MTNSYLFEIKDVGTWLVDVDDGKVTVTEGEAEADVRIGMSEEIFQQARRRQQNPMTRRDDREDQGQGQHGGRPKLGKILG